MKVRELYKVPSKKIGRVNKNGIKTEPHEDSTALYLTQFGLNIEFIKPRNTNKARTADLLMMDAAWEAKSPTSSNETTIKTVFKRASSQSDRIIFDLRRVKRCDDKVEKQIVKMFSGHGRVRKMIIIRKNGIILEFSK